MKLLFTLLVLVILTVQTNSQITLGDAMDETAPLITGTADVYSKLYYEKYCRIIPQHSMSYDILSVTESDVAGFLYNSEGTLLAANDDYNGLGLNFQITYNLIQGETYYIGIENYYGDYVITLHVVGGLLPVELATFTASVNTGQVTLNWKTATEVNNYGFEILRRFAPQNDSHSDPDLSGEESQWEKIGFVEGAGNSNTPKEYTFIDNSSAATTTLSYRLKQIDLDGKYSYSKEITVELSTIPEEFSLSQNYPNPFNPTTTIEFSLPNESDVMLKVYNLLGQEVATLLSGQMKAGYHKVKFDASGISSGIYFYKIQAGDFSAVKKLMLLK